MRGKLLSQQNIVITLPLNKIYYQNFLVLIGDRDKQKVARAIRPFLRWRSAKSRNKVLLLLILFEYQFFFFFWQKLKHRINVYYFCMRTFPVIIKKIIKLIYLYLLYAIYRGILHNGNFPNNFKPQYFCRYYWLK